MTYDRVNSSQLTVLASSPIDRRMHHGLVAFDLARHTGANAGQRRASFVRDAVPAIFAEIASLTSRHAGSSSADCVVDRIVDLLLHRAIT
jgi:hypothetical protein